MKLQEVVTKIKEVREISPKRNFTQTFDLVFNLQNNRLNQVMKTLTIFSVIFIPLTFLAGIYGMNFDYIPETKSQYGYFILLGVMLVITLLTLFMIKKRNWFK